MKKLFALLMVLSFLAASNLVMAQGTVSSTAPAGAGSTPAKKAHKTTQKHRKKTGKKNKKAAAAIPAASGSK